MRTDDHADDDDGGHDEKQAQIEAGVCQGQPRLEIPGQCTKDDLRR